MLKIPLMLTNPWINFSTADGESRGWKFGANAKTPDWMKSIDLTNEENNLNSLRGVIQFNMQYHVPEFSIGYIKYSAGSAGSSRSPHYSIQIKLPREDYKLMISCFIHKLPPTGVLLAIKSRHLWEADENTHIVWDNVNQRFLLVNQAKFFFENYSLSPGAL